MHYKDGTEARLGDIVKGRGYNLKYDIQGVVVELKKEETCNITICHTIAAPYGSSGIVYRHERYLSPGVSQTQAVVFGNEYGEAKEFELVNRAV